MNRACCCIVTVLALAFSATHTKGQTQATPPADPAAMRAKAIDQVLLSSRSGNPFLRANAIESIQPVSDRARPMAQLGLQDPHPAVRFAAAITVGKLMLDGLEGAIAVGLRDEDPSVRAASLYAAQRLGMDVDISPLASFLASHNAGTRSNAAMVLGLLGDKGAVAMMKEMGQLPLPRQEPAARHAVFRIQLAEALVQLGDNQALEAIRAGAYSSFDEARIVAVQAMGRLRDQQMAPALQRLQSQAPMEVRLAAAHALAEMNGAADMNLLLTAAGYTPERVLADAREMQKRATADDVGFIQVLLDDPQARAQRADTIRASAAFVLGKLNNPAAMSRLTALLNDPSEQVRLSAAAAVLRGPVAGPVAQP